MVRVIFIYGSPGAKFNSNIQHDSSLASFITIHVFCFACFIIFIVGFLDDFLCIFISIFIHFGIIHFIFLSFVHIHFSSCSSWENPRLWRRCPILPSATSWPSWCDLRFCGCDRVYVSRSFFGMFLLVRC